MTERDRPYRGTEDFCLIHGYEHMRSRMGDPIPYCEACEREREARTDGETATGGKK